MFRNSLQLTHKRLHAHLWDNFIMFIPEIELPKEILKDLEFLQEIQVFNKPMCYRKSEGVYFYEKRFNVDIFSKGNVLENNLFLLLELRGKLKEYEFNYLIEKYFEMASNLFFVTDWLNKNKSNLLVNYTDVASLFQIQFLSYSKHFEELVKHFYPDKKDMPYDRLNIQELIKEHLPDITKRYHKEDNFLLLPPIDYKEARTIETTENLDIKKVSLEKLVVSKPKKKKLITNEEAEKELLLKLFKVQ